MIDQVVEYIKQYRETYSREAIDSQLLGAGYSQQEIDAAWRAAADEDVGVQTPSVDRYRDSKVVVLVMLCLLLGVGAGIVLFGTDFLLIFSNARPERQALKNFAVIILNIGSLAAGVALLVVIARLLRRKWPVGQVAAIVLVAAFLWFTIILGTCLYGPNALN